MTFDLFSHLPLLLPVAAPVAAFTYPNIDPYIFSFSAPWGGVMGVKWYSLSYIVGVLFGWWWMKVLLSRSHLWARGKAPFAPPKVDEIVFSLFLGVLVGGRLGYVLFYNPAYFLANPLEIFFVWQGGMSFHGGLVGVALAGWLEARRGGFSWCSMLDLLAAAAPVGILLGRLSNFINAELYGRVADVPWAMVFPGGGSEPRHPSQLYEAALEGGLLMVVLLIAIFRFGSLARPLLTAGIFVFGYGSARFFVEFFREPDAHLGFIFAGVTMGMLLSLPMIILGIAMMFSPARGRGGGHGR